MCFYHNHKINHNSPHYQIHPHLPRTFPHTFHPRLTQIPLITQRHIVKEKSHRFD